MLIKLSGAIGALGYRRENRAVGEVLGTLKLAAESELRLLSNT